MELRQQIEAWQTQCNTAPVNSTADMLVATRLIAHGLNALDRIAYLEADLTKVREERDNWITMESNTAQRHAETLTALATVKAERDAAVAAWECAKRQNAHDMLLSGDEIHQHDAAIAREVK